MRGAFAVGAAYTAKKKTRKTLWGPDHAPQKQTRPSCSKGEEANRAAFAVGTA